VEHPEPKSRKIVKETNDAPVRITALFRTRNSFSD
jgi:hypothetical protein